MNNDNIIFVSQNVQGLRNNLKRINLDAIVQNMIYRNLSVSCIQETWLDGNLIKEIEGYTIFHQCLENKKICKRDQNGVAINLSPEFTIFYNKSGSKPQVNPTISSSVKFGRLLGLKLSINVKTVLKGAFQKKKKSNEMQSINLFISSVHHPTDKKLQKQNLTIIYQVFILQFLHTTSSFRVKI